MMPRMAATTEEPRRTRRRASEAPANLLALQRALYRRQRRQIEAIVESPSPAFKAYESRYRRAVRSFQKPVPLRSLLDAVRRADVIHVGDYHTLPRAQQTFVELCEAALATGRPVTVALEFVQGRFQQALDRYVAGALDEAGFLRAIGYRRHQVFDVWPGFRPILALARSRRLQAIGIDLVATGAGSLARRDRYAAERIAEAAANGAQGPKRPIVLVLTGQLHIAPAHLPAEVSRELSKRGVEGLRQLVVYQNCEEIYWRLAAEGRAHETSAVQVRENEFCLLNASPVVCQQSFLDFLEGEDASGAGPRAARDAFAAMARTVGDFVGVPVQKALGSVRVHACDDLTFLAALEKSGRFNRRELAAVKRQILSRESYYLPQARTAYLASLSPSHGAEEAAHFVRHVCVGDAMESERPGRDAFYARAYEEALGFFGSKLVNPRRQCAKEPELIELLTSTDGAEQAAAALALMHKRLERGEKVRFPEQLFSSVGSDLFNRVTHLLGYIAGERLYAAAASGRIDKAGIRELFLDPLSGPGDAERAYFELCGRRPADDQGRGSGGRRASRASA